MSASMVTTLPLRLAAVETSRDGELVDLIRELLTELRRFNDAVVAIPARPESPDGQQALTRREIEVLRRMAQGDTNARIARRLCVTEGTVKTHVQNILRKLGAANRAEAVSRWAQPHLDRRVGSASA